MCLKILSLTVQTKTSLPLNMPLCIPLNIFQLYQFSANNHHILDIATVATNIQQNLFSLAGQFGTVSSLPPAKQTKHKTMQSNTCT